MKTRLKINLNDLTINGHKYANRHAFNTAWLHHRILTERLDYQQYTRKYKGVNKQNG